MFMNVHYHQTHESLPRRKSTEKNLVTLSLSHLGTPDGRPC